MPTPIVRSAAPEDSHQAVLPDVLPDRWREGDNCRSFVAVAADGRLLGHCRAVDNVFHPESRTLLLALADPEQLSPAERADIEDALLRAQIDASTLPLRLKPSEDEPLLVDLCRRHGAVLVQLMPPWRYPVGPRLRAWAADHRAVRPNTMASPGLAPATGDVPVAEAAGDAHLDAMLDLYVEHYRAQHAAWSPAAAPEELRRENAADFVAGAEGAPHPDLSTVLWRDGHLVAQALVWPAEPDGSREVTLQNRSGTDGSARADMEACLAGVIERSADGDVLLIDSHATEALESAMVRDVPRDGDDTVDAWTAIIGIPVPGGPAPIPIPREAIPAAALTFARSLGARD